MMDMFDVYVLTCLAIDPKGEVVSKNVGVTFNLHDAEAHRAEGVEHEFETFQIAPNWQEDAEQSELISAMREFREMVKRMQDEALR
jgi:hypothetical protein